MTTATPGTTGTTETRLGVCNLCEAICGLVLTIDRDARRVVGVRGNPDDPLSRGHVCPKGVALGDVHADPDRLRRPVRRVGEGDDARWEELEWDEALDLVADRLAATLREHGDDAVGVYLGNPNAHSLGFSTHGPHLVRALRTRNRFSASTVDQMPHQVVARHLYGHQLLIPVPDLDRTAFFLVVGANPMASNGSLMTVPDFPQRVRELHGRGGRMVVLDPRRTETARVADEHHFVRPNTDAALLLAMLHVLIADGLARPPAYVDGLERLAELVAPFTPEAAAPWCGVDAAVIRRLAHELAQAPAGVVYGRIGVSTHAFGTLCQWAIACLNLLSGHADAPGGAMFPEPAADTVGLRVLGPGTQGRWRSRVRDAEEVGGELPAVVMAEEIATPGEGRIRAMVTIAGNPVLSTPSGDRLGETLAGLDFMVSLDIYLNETTRHADVVLPPTTLLERDHYDLVFHGFAVRNTARWTPAVFEPDDDQRHDWQIAAALAHRLAERLDAPLPASAAGALDADPRDLVAMLLAGTGRTTFEELLEHPEGVDLGPLRPTLPGRLQTADQRIDLVPEALVADLPRLAAAMAEPPGDGLVLIGRRHQRDCNSWLHNTDRLTRGRPRHHLLMHPDDLAARGLADGDRVRVASRVGSVETEVSADDALMPGVVSLPHGYGHGAAGTRLGHANTVPGVSVNDLTDPSLVDPVSGNAALTGVPVEVTAGG
ncbi:molybdopterin-dependent oxidoreductase [Nocardioides sp. TRM66260-LWL]|uniref:molybdopterin-dependent oxidoreductase n=1 Tax=Nocardioides sp. TRM66260-LWL TaxID=2874478 RepID=UPI001CC81D42|nr:molybdopterin-dependent oxidoreductase [Nocardioides sp. TRM66260-LWL]MBZ5734355.1 molybdopterin-dependent oxidoreductase [Nocardioides sp. TRM66260-LWL]